MIRTRIIIQSSWTSRSNVEALSQYLSILCRPGSELDHIVDSFCSNYRKSQRSSFLRQALHHTLMWFWTIWTQKRSGFRTDCTDSIARFSGDTFLKIWEWSTVDCRMRFWWIIPLTVIFCSLKMEFLLYPSIIMRETMSWRLCSTFCGHWFWRRIWERLFWVLFVGIN